MAEPIKFRTLEQAQAAANGMNGATPLQYKRYYEARITDGENLIASFKVHHEFSHYVKMQS